MSVYVGSIWSGQSEGGGTYMMALTRRSVAMATISASRIRIVRRVSILYHFNVIAAPRTA